MQYDLQYLIFDLDLGSRSGQGHNVTNKVMLHIVGILGSRQTHRHRLLGSRSNGASVIGDFLNG